MADAGYTLFETAIGTCGVAWRQSGIVTVQLPEATVEKTVARLLRSHGDPAAAEPPGAVYRAVDAMTALLAGEAVDLTDVAVDFGHTPDWDRSVYDLARAVPVGETTTYGTIAMRLGDRALSRAVGQALGRNPVPIIVPCHRVMAAEGGLGGFSAPGGIDTKLHILSIELAHAPRAGLFDRLPLAVRPSR